MSARVTGSDYDGNTVVTVECEQANSMGVLETEDCGAEIECTKIGGVWLIPAQCDSCTNPIDRALASILGAECEDAVDNYDPTPWCGGCGSMTRSGCDCGPIARDN